MKTLLTFVLCLLASIANAATPSTKSFRGSGGIVVTSNDITALITIDGSGIAGPTNGVTAQQATNIAQAAASDRQYGSPVLTNLAAAFTNTVVLNAASNISLTLSNAVNNTRYVLACDTYPVVPKIITSNGQAAIMIIGKTNIVIDGGDALCTIISGGTTLGSMFYITNCDRITIKNITVKGYMLTNWWEYPYAQGWDAIGIAKCQNILIEKCRIIDHFNQGIADRANGVVLSTNNIIIRDNYFDNIGSYRTNFGGGTIPFDGTACDPTGWTVENNYFVNCLRAIEPYADASVGGITFNNCIIRGNIIRNCLENAITTAGSTNGHNILIENNHISWDQGYTRASSNIFLGSCGIVINGGQRHIIRGNTIINAAEAAIQCITDNDLAGYVIEDNVIRGQLNDGVGRGIHSSRSTGGIYTMRDFAVRNNYIENRLNAGIHMEFLRDSVISGNLLANCATNATTFSLQIAAVSNVVLSGNVIYNNGLAPPTAEGINIAASDKSIILSENLINGVTTPIVNSAGGEVQFVQQKDYATGNMRNDNTNVFTALRLAGQGTNALLGVRDGSNVVGVTIGSGLTLTAGTLTSSGGGGSLETNANQFGASTVLTLKNGVLTTNLNNYLTAFSQGFQALSGYGFSDADWAGGFALYSSAATFTAEESATTSVELGYLSGVTSAIQPQLSNDVRVAAGANVTVTPSGAGGVMTYTVASTGGGGSLQTNANQFGASVPLTLKDGLLITNATHAGTFNSGAIIAAGQVFATAFSHSTFGSLVPTLDGLWRFRNSTANDFYGLSFGGASQSNFLLQFISSSTGTSNGTINFRTGNTNGWLNVGVGLMTMPTLTPSRPLVLNASGNVTNAAGTPDGTKFLRDDLTLAVPPGSSIGLNQLTNVSIGSNYALFSGDVLTYNGPSGLWINVPSKFEFNYIITVQTNIVINLGTNTDQYIAVTSSNSFGVTYNGTPNNGDTLNIAVSNYSASIIYMTNAAFDTQWASNVTRFPVSANSIRHFTFASMTNLNLGVARWELRHTLEKESELAVAGGGLMMITNADGSIITISNSQTQAEITLTNNIKFKSALLSGAGTGSTNWTLSANNGRCWINGGANVVIVALMGYSATESSFPYYSITNLSGGDKGIAWSAVTNRFIPTFQQGNVLPSVLTNGTRLDLSMVVDNTNVVVSYAYTAWP